MGLNPNLTGCKATNKIPHYGIPDSKETYSKRGNFDIFKKCFPRRKPRKKESSGWKSTGSLLVQRQDRIWRLDSTIFISQRNGGSHIQSKYNSVYIFIFIWKFNKYARRGAFCASLFRDCRDDTPEDFVCGVFLALGLKVEVEQFTNAFHRQLIVFIW